MDDLHAGFLDPGLRGTATADAGAWQPPSADDANGYTPPYRLSRVLEWLLVANVILGVMTAASWAASYRLRGRMLDPSALVRAADLTAADDRNQLLVLLSTIVLLITGPVFIAWTRVLYRNLPALGSGSLHFKQGWAVGAWFVPVMHLWRPKQIVDDIWRASDPDLGPHDHWEGRRVAPLLHVWWAAWIGATILGLPPFASNGLDVESYRSTAFSETVSTFVFTVAAFVAFLVVRRLTDRHERRAALLNVDGRAGEALAASSTDRRVPTRTEIALATAAAVVFAISVVAFDSRSSASAASSTSEEPVARMFFSLEEGSARGIGI